MSSSSVPDPKRSVDGSGTTQFLLEQMNSEYRILQDKIDKIGAFRFTIRGWSVTLVIASIIAAGSSKVISPYVLALLLLFIYALWATEKKQNQHGRAFGDRALYLEKRIREELRSKSQVSTFVGFHPGIAHHLHSLRKKENRGSFRVWVTDPDHFFYLIQGLAVVVAIAVLSRLTPSSAPDRSSDQTVIQYQTNFSDAQQGTAKRDGNARPEIPERQERKRAKENN